LRSSPWHGSCSARWIRFRSSLSRSERFPSCCSRFSSCSGPYGATDSSCGAARPRTDRRAPGG